MKIAEKIWMNGKIVSSSKAKLFSFHQGLNFGACVYDGLRCHKTKNGVSFFRINDHIDRLFYSASVLEMNFDYSKEQIHKAIIDLVKVNKISSGYIRPIIFYSDPKMGINILGSKVTFMILVFPWDSSKESLKPTKLLISKYTRISPKSIDLKAKISGYYSNGLLGFIEAKKQGYDQPLFLDDKGYLTESAVSNIFVVKDNVLYTPTTNNSLNGFTRDTILKIVKDIDLKVVEKNIKPEFLKNADEVFLTGTGVNLQPVESVKGFFKSKNNNKIINQIDDYYKKVIFGEVRKYSRWVKFLSP